MPWLIAVCRSVVSLEDDGETTKSSAIDIKSTSSCNRATIAESFEGLVKKAKYRRYVAKVDRTVFFTGVCG